MWTPSPAFNFPSIRVFSMSQFFASVGQSIGASASEMGTTEDEMVEWHHWLVNMSLSKLQESVIYRKTWHAAVLGVAKSWTQLSDWTELMWPPIHFALYKIFCNSFLSLIMICTIYLNLNLFLYYFSIVFVLARCHYLHNFTVLPL